MIKNVFITGGFGQDGKILTDLLISKRVKLNVLFRNNKKIIRRKNVNFTHLDLNNKKK